MTSKLALYMSGPTFKNISTFSNIQKTKFVKQVILKLFVLKRKMEIDFLPMPLESQALTLFHEIPPGKNENIQPIITEILTKGHAGDSFYRHKVQMIYNVLPLKSTTSQNLLEPVTPRVPGFNCWHHHVIIFSSVPAQSLTSSPCHSFTH